jgi:predicted CXXCH cytochrome family protein
MNCSVLARLIPVLIVSALLPSLAFSKDNCFDCHGQKGSSGYVDRVLYEQSAHGFLECGKCHTDISGYPHQRRSKVNCGTCHFLGKEGAPEKQAREYQLSVHGRASSGGRFVVPTCQTCHGYHYIYPSSDTRSSTYKQKIPQLCATCHPKEFEAYSISIHGKELMGGKNNRAATCFDCHLEHLTPSTASDQWKLALIKECGTCHEGQMKSYRTTYHGQVTELGYATMAKCSDCHGSHDILRVDNPESALSQKNILKTCRKCHPAATPGFTEFYAHPDVTSREKYPVLYYTFVFMTILLIGVFSFFFLHTFLWAYRSLRERMRKKGGG